MKRSIYRNVARIWGVAVGGMFLGIPLGFWVARLTDPYFATWAILSHTSEVKKAFFVTAILTALVSGYLAGWLLEKIFRLHFQERTVKARSRKYQVTAIIYWAIAGTLLTWVPLSILIHYVINPYPEIVCTPPELAIFGTLILVSTISGFTSKRLVGVVYKRKPIEQVVKSTDVVYRSVVRILGGLLVGRLVGVPLGVWGWQLLSPIEHLADGGVGQTMLFNTTIATGLAGAYLAGKLIDRIESRRRGIVLTWTIAVPLFVYSILGFCTGLAYKGIPEPTVNRSAQRISIGWKTYFQRQVFTPRPPRWSPGQPLPGETIEASERTIEIGLFRNRYIKYPGLCLPLPGSTKFGIIAIKETWVNSLSE